MRQPLRPLVFLPLLAGVAGVAGLASCANPRTETNVAQALSDAATEIGGLKSDIADLQSRLDSLGEVVAKQDTLIDRIADINHIPR